MSERSADRKRASYLLIETLIILGANESLLDELIQCPFLVDIMSYKVSSGVGVMLDDLIGFQFVKGVLIALVGLDEKAAVIGSFFGDVQKTIFSPPMNVTRLVSGILNLLFPNDIPKTRVTDVFVNVGVILQILIEVKRSHQESEQSLI